ncbi:MAG: UDP-N-acetylmuramoyl-L-alanine--D-glutamate ligase [Planctomycetota bacterium]
MTEWSGRRVLVAGLGRFGGGAGAVRFLAAAGARVTVTDRADEHALADSLAQLADVEFERVLGRHREADFRAAEVVVANPALAPGDPLLVAARAAGARVTSEIELYLERAPAPLFLVSGTQGKSSTVTMLRELLAADGRRVLLGGNVGGSLLSTLADAAPDAIVLELSSYQLEALAPDIGTRVAAAGLALTNVLADHLERHGDERSYARAKRRLLELGRGPCVLPAGLFPAERATRFALDGEAELTLREGGFYDGDTRLGDVAALGLPAFQRSNALVALGLAHRTGVAPATLAATIERLSAPEHRCQDLGLWAGRRVVDNGVSTTPDSTAAVLLEQPAGTVLLAGGAAKRLPLEGLARLAAARDVRTFAFGAAAQRLADAWRAAGAHVEPEPTFAAAVERAFRATPVGGTLLFSPACASFDAFPNFRERALTFRRLLETYPLLETSLPGDAP